MKKIHTFLATSALLVSTAFVGCSNTLDIISRTHHEAAERGDTRTADACDKAYEAYVTADGARKPGESDAQFDARIKHNADVARCTGGVTV